MEIRWFLLYLMFRRWNYFSLGFLFPLKKDTLQPFSHTREMFSQNLSCSFSHQTAYQRGPIYVFIHSDLAFESNFFFQFKNNFSALYLEERYQSYLPREWGKVLLNGGPVSRTVCIVEMFDSAWKDTAENLIINSLAFHM